MKRLLLTQPPVRRFLTIACVTLWITAFAASHIPMERLPRFRASDRTLHFLGFVALTSLFVLALAAHRTERKKRIPVVILTMALYAMLDEATQPLVNRYGDISDVVADLIGTAVALGFWEPLLVLYASRRRAK